MNLRNFNLELNKKKKAIIREKCTLFLDKELTNNSPFFSLRLLSKVGKASIIDNLETPDSILYTFKIFCLRIMKI